MIFYFHGYSSGADSQKANAIRKYLNKFSIFIPEYPSHQPRESVATLQEYINSHLSKNVNQGIMLMGSSLGGYYAQYLATKVENVKALVLINPCLQPQITLESQIGHQVNSVTGESFEFTQADYDALSEHEVEQQNLFEPALVLLDEGDELIDYQVAEKRYRPKGRVIVYPGGDHWFRHLEEALPEIESYYLSMVLQAR